MKSAKGLPVILTALIFFLTSCAGNDLAFEEIKDGLCSQKQEQLIEKHISGQINALSDQTGKKHMVLPLPHFRR